jgi:hypothetical protein
LAPRGRRLLPRPTPLFFLRDLVREAEVMEVNMMEVILVMLAMMKVLPWAAAAGYLVVHLPFGLVPLLPYRVAAMATAEVVVMAAVLMKVVMRRWLVRRRRYRGRVAGPWVCASLRKWSLPQSRGAIVIKMGVSCGLCRMAGRCSDTRSLTPRPPLFGRALG